MGSNPGYLLKSALLLLKNMGIFETISPHVFYLEVAPDVPAEAEISPSMMRSSWLLRFLSMDWGNSSSHRELFLDLT